MARNAWQDISDSLLLLQVSAHVLQKNDKALREVPRLVTHTTYLLRKTAILNNQAIEIFAHVNDVLLNTQILLIKARNEKNISVSRFCDAGEILNIAQATEHVSRN